MGRLGVALLTCAASLAACGPGGATQERTKAPPCPAPPEPANQAVVVGTIGRLHLAESRYPLARLGEVLAAYRPDLVLVGARVDPFREDRLEDASFEMTYVTHLARSRGIPVEPIDWFDDADRQAAEAPIDPPEAAEIERREAAVLRLPRLYTFEQANGAELGERILLATTASARYRRGDPLATRRRSWLTHLAADATIRHGKPRRVLAFVDVLDRPTVDLALRGLGYDGRLAVDVVAKSREVPATSDVPGDVLDAYRAQASRARAHGDANGEDRARFLDLVVEKKGTCCVPQSSLESNRRTK